MTNQLFTWMCTPILINKNPLNERGFDFYSSQYISNCNAKLVPMLILVLLYVILILVTFPDASVAAELTRNLKHAGLLVALRNPLLNSMRAPRPVLGLTFTGVREMLCMTSLFVSEV